MHDVKRDGGFTMLEMIVTLALGSILMATATWGMHSYLVSTRESGTATDVRSALRNAAERSLSEGRTYCVYLQSTKWTLYKYACSGTTPAGIAAQKVSGPFAVQDPSITITSVNFPAPSPASPNQVTNCPTAGKCAYFYPRGNALAGSLKVVRSGKTYTINVEGLTARVSTS